MDSFETGFIKRAADYGVAPKTAKNILMRLRHRMSKEAAGLGTVPAVTQQLPKSGLQSVPKMPSVGGSPTVSINASTIRPNLAPVNGQQNKLMGGIKPFPLT